MRSPWGHKEWDTTLRDWTSTTTWDYQKWTCTGNTVVSQLGAKCWRAGVEFLVLSLPSCVTQGKCLHLTESQFSHYVWGWDQLQAPFRTQTAGRSGSATPTSEDVIVENRPDPVLRWFRLLMQSAGKSAWVIESHLNVIYCGCQYHTLWDEASLAELQGE